MSNVSEVISKDQPETDSSARSLYSDRAQYYVPTNSFNAAPPKVPVHAFEKERIEALRKDGGSAIITLDLSGQLGLSFPATLPNVLARYIRLIGGEACTLDVDATSVVYYAISGRGTSSFGNETLTWNQGDVFVLPGQTSARHTPEQDALLYALTDEPFLDYMELTPRRNSAHTQAVLYTREEIDRHLEIQYSREANADDAGKAVIFSTNATRGMGTTTPLLTVNINTLPAGQDQRAHRHNPAALTLSVEGEDVHSVVDGTRVEWKESGVLLTPPGALHSHHSRGAKQMRSIVVQDSGIFYHSRIIGFRFDE
ncbi:cupin domain-containing protein [Paraburkholderia bannensis]|uniref:cupin domain-containing protein n=1 Tax=Paraburkholderia bannensis TaxID=765414 RepID=UPI002AB6D984|nr:cupin domain-containing protein [Paraburkholderia bannensis]